MSNGSTYWIEEKFLFMWWELDEHMSIWSKTKYVYPNHAAAGKALDDYFSRQPRVVEEWKDNGSQK